MKISTPRPLLFSSAMIVSALAIGASAQSSPPAVTEEFDLNITNERITETNFTRTTAVSADGQNVRVNVGVAVAADRIDLTMRGVTGHVRFRGSLDTLWQRLQQISTRPK